MQSVTTTNNNSIKIRQQLIKDQDIINGGKKEYVPSTTGIS
jgi:hypothetical protein